MSISCTGFEYVEFLVADISLGGWASFDFALKFTTVSKTWDTCISLDGLAFDCFTVELGFGNTGYVDTVIDNITIHGVKFATTWGGVKFTSVTEFDAYSTLMSTSTAYTYMNGPL